MSFIFSSGRKQVTLYLAIAASFPVTCTLAGQRLPKPLTPSDISELAPEELMKLRVTSASKKEQTLSRVGAALFVLTREDILSSGAQTIPDLLRLVPGVEVSQINANQWAISIRGFNTLYSNKVLAMIDGRALYQPSFSGVLWDQQDLPLEDIERVEVIRGPGGTIWGANAVNGVINIITRHSRDTQGELITAAAGSRRTGEGLVQYGGTLGSAGTYRAFGKYFDVNSSVSPGGQRANDGWHSWAGGFRSDWDAGPRDTLTVQGDLRQTVAGGTGLATFTSPQPFQAVVNSPIRNTLADVMGAWHHVLEGGSETTLRVYFDHMLRDGEAGANVRNDTADVDFEHHLEAGARNDIVWGVDLRVYSDDIHASTNYSLQIIPPHRTVPFVSGFFQDEIRLTNSFFLTVGSKLEHNDYTGVEYEPGVQLVWTPSGRHTLWSSAAIAIRQPDRVDFGVRLMQGLVQIGGFPAVLTLSGSSEIKAEELHDYEIGYRGLIQPHFALDLTAFFSNYHDLETSESGTPYRATNANGSPYTVLPLTFANLGRARDYGAEGFLRWTPLRRWTIGPGYSFLHMSTQHLGNGPDFGIGLLPGYSAKHHFLASSSVNLRSNVDWSATVRYVTGLATPHIPSYLEADTTLRWRPSDSLEMSVSGQNLLSPRHLEFGDPSKVLIPSEVQRSAFVKLAWHF